MLVNRSLSKLILELDMLRIIDHSTDKSYVSHQATGWTIEEQR